MINWVGIGSSHYLRCHCRRLTRKFSMSPVPKVADKGEYDLVVLGGGSGGISCAQQARCLGSKVALLDYVSPSPQGSTWGLGGTCVNVGCIPKKLMHQAALLGEAIKESELFGWTRAPTCARENNWEELTTAVRNHVKSVNWLTRVSLREAKIDYINAKAKFLDPHTILGTSKDGSQVQLTAKNVLIAVGGRPRSLDIPGAELAITSDDIFTLPKAPGKTLVVGAGYIALECAGFLRGLNHPVAMMVRGAVLRGFDQQMANLIADNLQEHGVRFLRNSNPLSFQKTSSEKILVKFESNGVNGEEEFDTVLLAVGRLPETTSLDLGAANVNIHPETRKVIGLNEQTNVPHIYAVGDVLHGTPELTPVAIQAGKLLARRLFGGSTDNMDYNKVATTVFTPLEYGSVGYGEEAALEKYGEDNLEVYHSFYKPTEFMISQKSFAQCYLKVICLRKERTILGMHFLGPVAGEVIQGYAVALKCGVTMEQLTDTVGIHPTVSEEFTRLFITKRSGLDPSPQICCS